MTEFSVTHVDRCRIYSQHQGTGPDVVLLHGLSGSSRWWRYTVPALAPYFRAHAPDLVGFGRSRGSAQPTIEEMADLVVDWMQARGIIRPHLIGHSMGGQIAIHIAAHHGDAIDRLVLVSAAGTPRRISLAQAVRFLTEIAPPRAWGAPRFLPTLARDALRAGPFTLSRATGFLMKDDVRPLLPLIRAQTLLIWGRHDALTPLRDGKAMATAIPNARLIVYDRAAHMPMVDRAERFNADVLSFLRA